MNTFPISIQNGWFFFSKVGPSSTCFMRALNRVFSAQWSRIYHVAHSLNCRRCTNINRPKLIRLENSFFLILAHAGKWGACTRIETLGGPPFPSIFDQSIEQIPQSSNACAIVPATRLSNPSLPHTRLSLPATFSATHVRSHNTFMPHISWC